MTPTEHLEAIRAAKCIYLKVIDELKKDAMKIDGVITDHLVNANGALHYIDDEIRQHIASLDKTNGEENE